MKSIAERMARKFSPGHVSTEPPPQEVKLPAVQLALTGLKAGYHIIRHNTKFQRCPLDAGMDLFPSEIQRVVEYGSMAVIWVHTMLIVHLAPGLKATVEGRSSSEDRLCGGICKRGIIDAGYSGEIMIAIIVPNKSDVDRVSEAIRICQREHIAIAQLLVEQSLTIFPVEAKETPESISGRGSGGFGHTDNLKP